MSVLNFKEIPNPCNSTGKQDNFELFARDYFDYLGYNILDFPNRGADDGKDFIIEELRTGVGGQTKIKWLVSCKHKAHSGNSVKPTDEIEIGDRIVSHDCNGFIGFYSTLPSSGLSKRLLTFQKKFEIQVFDYESIEKYLLNSTRGIELAKRYFPNSINNWLMETPNPAKIYIEEIPLLCDNCGKNLLLSDNKGVVVLCRKKSKHGSIFEISKIYFACKGHCDMSLRNKYRTQGLSDSWEDISDLMIPTIYLKWIIAILNKLQNRNCFSKQAFDKIQDLFISIFPIVCRHLTTKEKKRIELLLRMPSYLGGLNTDLYQ